IRDRNVTGVQTCALPISTPVTSTARTTSRYAPSARAWAPSVRRDGSSSGCSCRTVAGQRALIATVLQLHPDVTVVVDEAAASGQIGRAACREREESEVEA